VGKLGGTIEQLHYLLELFPESNSWFEMESDFIFFDQLIKLTQRHLKVPMQFLVHSSVRRGRNHTWADLGGTSGLLMLLVGEELHTEEQQRTVQVPPPSPYPGDPGGSTCRTCLKWGIGFMSCKREAVKKEKKYLKCLWVSDVALTDSSQAACSNLSPWSSAHPHTGLP